MRSTDYARLLLLSTAAFVTACGPDPENEEAAGSPDAEVGGIFTDVTKRSGIEFRLETGKSEERYLFETMLGGVGWIDFDGDGFLDLYLANGHASSVDAWKEGRESDRLYRNNGDGTFEDVTVAAGIREHRYSNGVAVADYDNDGHSDLLVTNVGRNTLYHNRGDGSFEDVTESAGLTDEGFNASAVWFDADRDGDLDLYITRYLRYRPRLARPCREGDRRVYCDPRFFEGESDLLYENTGDGKFADISAKAGITRAGPADGKGLGVIAGDFDADGWPDIYVANDSTANFLWHNRRDGTFRDRAFEAGVALSASGRAQAGMGVDLGDVNGDGHPDIHVTNFSNETNNLFLGDGKGNFVEGVQRSKLGRSFGRLGFGCILADFDLDGDLDLVTANGHVNDNVDAHSDASGSGVTYRQPPDFFRNDGDGKFVDDAQAGGPVFAQAFVGRGLASADFDNDGDLDLALMTLNRSLVLLRNETREDGKGPHFLRVRLRGTASPRDGYGARIEAQIGDRVAICEYQSGRSYLSAVDPRAIFGLGSATKVDRLTVHWPRGTVQVLEDIAGDREIVIVEPD
jgi:hypothetical protein